ncbi:LuxR C-terminal-related transcriptional regulator [Paenibacillus tuaregi]|uniref:LuxR C-terminal-related transcriptional regulator n=1 Tax=Paenibacillus tuaregi TaxID=1816681 RepID=UPI000838E5C7|nr:LuxR C-terminal-related transcriptional regulator [Paenibacillus tuaregi]
MDYCQRITIVSRNGSIEEQRQMAELRQIIKDKLQTATCDTEIQCYWEQRLQDTAEENYVLSEVTLPLSGRQRQIAELLCAHHSIKKIAAQLHISEHTVKKHIQNMKKELQITGSGLDFVYELQKRWKGGN